MWASCISFRPFHPLKVGVIVRATPPSTPLRASGMKTRLTREVLATTFACTLILLVSISPGWCATFKVLHHFTGGDDGFSPSWGVAQDSQGNLFGTTGGGGKFQGGVVFELSPNQDGTWNETTVHDFNFSSDEGSGPATGVTLDDKGNLYGSTVSGGPNDSGTTFELSPNGGGWTISVILNNGAGHMILDKAGDLYGPFGPGDYLGGAVGRLSPATNEWTYTALYSFCHNRPLCSDGIEPNEPLAWDTAGNLYGTTFHGGIYPYPFPCADNQGCGVAYQMRPRPDGTWAYRILHWFGAFPTDGVLLNGGLVVDSKGNVYGSTGVGGPTFSGTVFKLSPKPPGQWGQTIGYSQTQLYTFPDCAQGCGPENPLVMDKAGSIYGTAGGGNTSCGGFYCGVVFRLSPQRDGTWKYMVVHKFNWSDGQGPAGITVDANGTLLGTTRAGGQFNHGLVFEITP